MSDPVTITVSGWVAKTPKLFVSENGTGFVSLRVATSPRRRTADGAWGVGQTEWYTVKVWRQAAENVAQSLHKGDPVLVHGRLSTHEWISECGPRTDLVIDARSLGHDLSLGRSLFTRVARLGQEAEQGAEGDATADAPACEGVTADDPWATSALETLSPSEADATAVIDEDIDDAVRVGDAEGPELIPAR